MATSSRPWIHGFPEETVASIMTFAQALALTSVGAPQDSTVINILEPLGGDPTVPAATVAEILPSEFEEQVVNHYLTGVHAVYAVLNAHAGGICGSGVTRFITQRHAL